MSKSLSYLSNPGEEKDPVQDVDLLFEIGTLRHIERSWRQFGGLPFANVAEHTFRTAFIALILAVREKADVGKTVQMALVHDIHEARTGDANYVQKMYRKDLEDLAFQEMGHDTSAAEHFCLLHEELEAGSTLEAKIVKDADNLDCDFELAEMRDRGATFASYLEPTRHAVRRGLKTDAARLLYPRLQDRSSHDWHLNARNRMNAGDWRNR